MGDAIPILKRYPHATLIVYPFSSSYLGNCRTVPFHWNAGYQRRPHDCNEHGRDNSPERRYSGHYGPCGMFSLYNTIQLHTSGITTPSGEIIYGGEPAGFVVHTPDSACVFYS